MGVFGVFWHDMGIIQLFQFNFNYEENVKRKLSEHQEQVCLFQWAEIQKDKYPELKWMFAIPNGGSRNKKEGALLKAEGVKAGVSDIFLPVARCGFYGLFLEMKKEHQGITSELQIDFQRFSLEQGYLAVVCHGAEKASLILDVYMQGNPKNLHIEGDNLILEAITLEKNSRGLYVL